jgi:hypothetical protein
MRNSVNCLQPVQSALCRLNLIEAKHAQCSDIQWVPAASLAKVKQPGRETDNSPLFSADLKKA